MDLVLTLTHTTVDSVAGICTPDGIEVLSPLHMVANEVLHVRVRPKLRPPVYSDASGHLESHMRVSFPGIHTASPTYRRSHSLASPLPPRSGHEAETEASAESESTYSTATSTAHPKSKASSSGSGNAPIVSIPGLRHRRIKRQQSVPALPRGDESTYRRSSITGASGSRTPPLLPPYPGKTAATFEDVEWSHRRPSLGSTSSASSERSPPHSTDADFVTPTKSTASAPTTSPLSAGSYHTAVSTSATPTHDAHASTESPTKSCSDSSPAPARVDAMMDNADAAPARRKKRAPTKAMQGTRLLFSPLAADQETPKQKHAFTLDDDDDGDSEP